MSTYPSLSWILYAKKFSHQEIILSWETVIPWNLNSWGDFAAMAAIFLLTCRPPKITSGYCKMGKACFWSNLILKWWNCRFTSDYFESGHGFKLHYSSTNTTEWTYGSGECGGNFTTPNGIITSPSYPGKYPNNADCIYTISQPTGTVILLQFLSMDMEDGVHGSCRFDYLEIRDGPTEELLVLHKLCGNEVPGHIQSNQSQVWMK